MSNIPRPSSYPLLGPKYVLLGTIYPQLRVQGGSWFSRVLIPKLFGLPEPSEALAVRARNWRQASTVLFQERAGLLLRNLN